MDNTKRIKAVITTSDGVVLFEGNLDTLTLFHTGRGEFNCDEARVPPEVFTKPGAIEWTHHDATFGTTTIQPFKPDGIVKTFGAAQ